MKKVLTLLVLASLLGSVNLLAQNSLGIIDFTGLGEHQNSQDFNSNGYLREVEGRLFYISNGTRQIRIQLDNTDNWGIYLDDQQNSYLNKKTTGYHSLFINGLVAGDKVKITPKGNICFGNNNSVGTQELGTYNYFDTERTFTITGNGRLEVKTEIQNNGVYKIEVFGDGGSVYNYDPSIEGYDLYWVGGGATYDEIDAGFSLDASGQNAILLAQLSDLTPLSRRIAISKNSNGSTPWSLSNFSTNITEASRGLYNTDENTWHNLSICNLKVGARVRITFHNEDYNSERNVGHAKFGSVGYSSYNGCAAFQDTNNNGVQDAGEESVTAGLDLAGSDNSNTDFVTYFYTITQDGHLDLAFDGKVRLCKVEIYNDHLATMVDRDNGSHETGYTSYFNNTGQLQPKVHTVPGGLRVLIGSDDVNQHAGVVASPTDPMAFVYDETHRKFPRNSNNDFCNDLTTNLPTEGTFHRFTPEVDGKMIVKFFTASINYLWPEQDGSFSDMDNTSNENSVDVDCPYYLIKVDQSGNKEIVKSIDSFNEEITWEEDVQAGYTYYLFGGWSAGATANNYSEQKSQWMKKNRYGCGIANLLDVTFIVEKAVYPLAKWIENASESDDDLAYVKGYKYVKVKKMSGNIESCHPYLDGTTLKIDQIVYKDGDVNKGGVILIEFTDDLTKYDRTDPVFALTVAYDAAYHSDNQHAEAERGHTWDFSSNPLNGLQWNDTYSTYAVVTPFGTSTEENSLLNQEMNWTDVHGTQHSDWTFGYRSQQSGNSYDPQFINHYDLSGDNADMMWDTEGVVMFASANFSSIFNEKIGAIDRTNKTQADPDRYVGLWPHSGEGLKSEFIIPHLDKDDRVIIWMGSGTGPESETKEMVFNITNARDAEYKEISATDNYVAGGSHWNVVKNEQGQVVTNDPYYRGCYHFFAKADGDMRFKLVGGTMCKIYKIQIYRGDRIITNEIKGATTNDKYLLWSRAADLNDTSDDPAIGPTYNWTLKYFGKDQKLANGKKADGTTGGVNNDIVAWTGAGISTKTLTTSDETDPTAATYNTFTFQHDYNTIGTFRARGKDMEKNMKYVADYGEHNVTVAHQQTMKYPYTWDLMDMTGWSNNATRFINEDAYGSLYKPRPEWFDNDPQWNASYEKSSTDLSLFGKAVGNDQGYVLRLNSQETPSAYPQDNIFESVQTLENNEPYYGNQLWRDGEIVPESQGLWFHTLDQNTLQGSMRVYNDGMSLGGGNTWRYNMVVPNVPKDAAIYMRIAKARDYDSYASYKFEGSEASNLTLIPVAWEDEEKENPTEWIVAFKNDKGAKKHLTLSLSGYRLMKLAVSEDPKTVNIKGYASESRNRVIDHTLTSFFTGQPIKAYLAKQKDDNTISLKEITKPMPAATADGQFVGSVLYNSDNANDTGEIKILDGGFHLFVPDMHDYTGDPNDAEHMITDELQSTSGNMMQSFNAGGTGSKPLSQTTSKDIYVLSYKYLEHDRENQATITGNIEAFYRLASSGANVKPNSAYIRLGQASTSQAKMSIVFEDELFGNQGITTVINDAVEENKPDSKLEWYSLDGQKLNGVPTAKGLYIVNGKKVLVK